MYELNISQALSPLWDRSIGFLTEFCIYFLQRFIIKFSYLMGGGGGGATVIANNLTKIDEDPIEW